MLYPTWWVPALSVRDNFSTPTLRLLPVRIIEDGIRCTAGTRFKTSERKARLRLEGRFYLKKPQKTVYGAKVETNAPRETHLHTRTHTSLHYPKDDWRETPEEQRGPASEI